MRKRILIGVTTIGLLVVLLYLAAGYVVYTRLGNVRHSCDHHLANRPDRFINIDKWPELDEFTPYFMEPYEAVYFPSRYANLQLAAWYVAGDPGAPAVILVGGLGGCKHAQALLIPAGMLWRNGFNVLLLDLHDTGESAGDDGYSTIGIDESMDIQGAWDWLMAEKGFAPEEIGILGNSLGGAVALYAFVDEPRMAALFLNSPIANLPQVIREELTRVGYPSWLTPGGLLMAQLLTGKNIVARNPLQEIQRVGDRPVFVAHSAADKRVAIHHSQQLQAAAEAVGVPVTFWYVDGADHMRIPAVYPAAFEEKIVGFFRTALAN
ncbi:MAG: prolyl oligopeptidase family serine peptidase [Caldilineaceae bacterium]